MIFVAAEHADSLLVSEKAAERVLATSYIVIGLITGIVIGRIMLGC